MSYAKRSRSTHPRRQHTTLDCVLITLTDGAVLAQNVITRTLSAHDEKQLMMLYAGIFNSVMLIYIYAAIDIPIIKSLNYV